MQLILAAFFFNYQTLPVFKIGEVFTEIKEFVNFCIFERKQHEIFFVFDAFSVGWLLARIV